MYASSEYSSKSARTGRLTSAFAASMFPYANSTCTKFHELSHYYNPIVALTCTQAVLTSLSLQAGSTWNTLQERKFASIIASENNMTVHNKHGDITAFLSLVLKYIIRICIYCNGRNKFLALFRHFSSLIRFRLFAKEISNSIDQTKYSVADDLRHMWKCKC